MPASHIDSYSRLSRFLLYRSLALLGLVLASPSHSAAGEQLRYKIEPEQVIPYTVKIEVETPNSVDTLSGIFSITGKQLDAETITLNYSGGLSKSSKAKRSSNGPGGFGPGGFGPGGFGPPMGRPGGFPSSPFDQPTFRGLTNTTSELVITKSGSVKSMRGDSQLPYLLGNLSLFPFEMLPDNETNQWQSGTQLTITSKSDSDSRFGPRFGPFANNNDEKTKTGGDETASYQIVDAKTNLVSITKTYSLTSPSIGKDDPGFKVNGTGNWIFNRAEGISESLNFKSEMVISEDNTDVRIPIKIEWKRMPLPEYQAILKERQDKLAALQAEAKINREKAARAAKEKEGKQLATNEKRTILADLNSSDWPTISRKLRDLRNFVPHPNDFDIAKRVKELRSHSVLSVSREAKELWDRLEPILEAAQASGTPSEMPQASGDNPFATEEEKAAASATAMRQWSDRTGAFKIEARFVRIDGDNAILLRKDNKEIKVPISRLSPDDQKILEGLRKK